MSLRSSRVVAVALVTAATFVNLVGLLDSRTVLPDLGLRLGASPTVIGLLFASFGVTVLGVSLPMGVVSDRVGRKLPMVAGMAALAASSLLLAHADRLAWLFAARLVQGAADAVTWVVGFALIADLYGPDNADARDGSGDVGANFGFMIGPTLGGWLYEAGGIGLPFVTLAGGAVLVWPRLPLASAPRHSLRARDGVDARHSARARGRFVRASRSSSRPPRSRCSSRFCRCFWPPSFRSARPGLAWCSGLPRSPRRPASGLRPPLPTAGGDVD